MNKQRKTILLILVITAILILLWFFRPHSRPVSIIQQSVKTNESVQIQNSISDQMISSGVMQTNSNSGSSPNDLKTQLDQKLRDMKEYSSIWRTPLLYYGKVIDENGNPIPGVQVSYGGNAINESLTKETRNEGSVTTDERGIFKIDGLYGIGLMFQLSHPNYYPYPDNSTGFDVRSLPRDGIKSDSEETARLFRMHTKGNPVALISRGGGGHKPGDGAVFNFPLRGNTQAEIIGQFQVQGWKGQADPPNSGHFDWKVRITAPDGGVLESTNYFDFIAPETGYQKTLEISETKDSPSWQVSTRRKFFFKLSNHFVRGQVYIDLYHDLYFSMDYFVNPDGSRNLELDSSRAIHPTQ